MVVKCSKCQKVFPSTAAGHSEKYRHKKKCNRPINFVPPQFTCETCTKTFTSKQYLKQHQITHSETRPFECEVCHKKFKRKKDVNKHRLTHAPRENDNQQQPKKRGPKQSNGGHVE